MYSDFGGGGSGFGGGFGGGFAGSFGGGFGGSFGGLPEDILDDDGEFGEHERAASVACMLPPNYAIRKVTGSHRKPCSECGTSDFYPGSYYIYDHVSPWGSDKYCLDCAEMHFSRDFESDDDDGEYDDDDVTPAPVRHADGGTYDASGWQSWPPVEAGEWGLVYVARGHTRGHDRGTRALVTDPSATAGRT